VKILTRTRFDKIDRYLAEAALLLRKAEVVCRNAHRTQRLHSRIDCALIVAKGARSEIEKRWQNGCLVPPRTRKVLRIEQKERETMGSLSAPEGRGAGDSRGMVPRDGKQGNPR
jgi:hypothetical protein